MLENANAERVAVSVEPSPGGVQNCKKILLVDDVKLFIELEKSFFQRREGFEILTAGNGEDALAIVAAQQPDLVYLDLHMPGMDGDECCRRIKELPGGGEIPVVIVTSAGRDEDRERCLDAGCDEIITKPINRAHFCSVSRKYLEVYDRKEPRYASHVRIKLSQGDVDGLSEYTVNLSAGGLFVSSSRLLPIDTELYVEFCLPQVELTFDCRARVAWINDSVNPLKRDLPAGMGLEFVEPSTEHIDAIRDYISKNALVADW